MSDTRPAPLVPAEVDLRSFETMPLAVQLLRDSRFVSEVKPEAFRAGVLLWCASWHQVPAGSLPSNDVELAKLAGYGFAVPQWKKLRSQALEGFVECSDGRLYHREVAARALVCWQSRLEHFYERARERLRKANKARAEKQLQPLADLTFEQWNTQRQAASLPPEKAEAFHQLSGGSDAGIPPEKALKGEGRERRGNGEGRGKTPPVGGVGPQPPAAAPPPGPELPGMESPPQLDEGMPPCPHQAIVALFAEVLPMARQVRDWTPARAQMLRARWREDRRRQTLMWWRRLFVYCSHSAWLTGRKAGANGRPFELSLDYLVKAENFAKVREGAYHDPGEADAAQRAVEELTA